MKNGFFRHSSDARKARAGAVAKSPAHQNRPEIQTWADQENPII